MGPYAFLREAVFHTGFLAWGGALILILVGFGSLPTTTTPAVCIMGSFNNCFPFSGGGGGGGGSPPSVWIPEKAYWADTPKCPEENTDVLAYLELQVGSELQQTFQDRNPPRNGSAVNGRFTIRFSIHLHMHTNERQAFSCRALCVGYWPNAGLYEVWKTRGGGARMMQ